MSTRDYRYIKQAIDANAESKRDRILKELRSPLGIQCSPDGAYFVTDKSTGEAIPLDSALLREEYGIDLGLKFTPKTTEDARLEKLGTAAAQRYYIQKDENAQKVDVTRGRFVFVGLERGAVSRREQLAPNIKFETLTRLCIMAGYLKWESEDIMCSQENAKKVITHNGMRKALGLSSATFRNFLRDAMDHGYITGSNEDGYKLNQIFWRGRIHGAYVQRLYVDALEQLYFKGTVNGNKIKPSDHRKIGKVLALTPYIHIEENILCWNPREKDVEKIKPLSSQDIISILSPASADDRNAAILLKNLQDITFTIDKKELYLLARTYKGSGTTNVLYTVCPHIIYFGSKDNYSRLIKSDYFYAVKQG